VAALFVRLKLALLRGGLRRSTQQLVSGVLALVFLVPLAAAAAIALAVAGRTTALGPLLATVTIAGLGLVWLVGPPLLFGIDETLDPARLALLPLRRRDLVVGMLAASAIGVGPLCTVVVLVGVAAAVAPPGPGALLVVAAVVAQFAVCLLQGRAVTTALATRLRSRRGRDLIGVVGGLVFLTLSQGPNLLTNVLDVEGTTLLEVAERVEAVAGFVPFAWAARAAVGAAAGETVAALGWLVATVAFAAALARWWTRALTRLVTESDQPRLRDAGANAPLFPSALRWLPRGRLGAAAARELRYYARENRYRVQTILAVVVGAGVVASAGLTLAGDPRVVLAATTAPTLFAVGGLNVFGAEGGATWLLVAVGGDHRADLTGKNLAGALLALALTLTAAVALAVVSGGWEYVPTAVALAAALVAVAYGVGNVTSVLAPFPQPENMFASSTGAGFRQTVSVFVGMLGIGLVALPILIATLVTALTTPRLLPAVAVGALGYGALVWWVGTRIAAARLRDRGPELLAALTPAR
jgi:ABC-2 type transport system permease protein